MNTTKLEKRVLTMGGKESDLYEICKNIVKAYGPYATTSEIRKEINHYYGYSN
jgi:hypothetical protein